MPRRLLRYMESWSRLMPAVRVVRWDESNFDVSTVPYVRDAHRAGKWAFVSDYARLDIVYRFGGIYLDTDVELVRSLEPLLYDRAFCARENAVQVNTGLVLAAEAGNPLIGEMRDAYLKYTFPSQACTVLQTEVLSRHGLKQSSSIQDVDGMRIYPQEFFNPVDAYGIPHPTEQTFAIHHAEASWMPFKWRLTKCLRRMVDPIVPNWMLSRLVAVKRMTMGVCK